MPDSRTDPPPARAFVAVGANLQPEAHILTALERLHRATPVRAVSPFYRTPALGRPEQPDYRNGIFEIETRLAPRALKFEVLRGIEAALGRVRSDDKYAARPIDLDLAVYGYLALDEPDLVLPDPDLAIRPFLAVPLWQLAPGLGLPGLGPVAGLFTADQREALVPDPALTRRLDQTLERLRAADAAS